MPPADAGSPLRQLAAHLLVTHAFPTVAVTFASAALGLIVAGPSIALFVAVLTVLASQVAVGSLNDYVDRAYDTIEQPTKPIPAGAIGPSTVLAQAIVASLLCLLLAAQSGPVGFALASVGLASGQVYNLWLKGTVFSLLPYLVSFACLPAFVLVTIGSFRSEWLALYPVGIPLILSFHLANALPDVAGDQRLGHQGLVPRLGTTRALMLCWSAFTVASGIAIAMGLSRGQFAGVLGAATGLALLMLAALFARSGTRSGLLTHFRLVVVGGLIVLGGLVMG